MLTISHNQVLITLSFVWHFSSTQFFFRTLIDNFRNHETWWCCARHVFAMVSWNEDFIPNMTKWSNQPVLPLESQQTAPPYRSVLVITTFDMLSYNAFIATYETNCLKCCAGWLLWPTVLHLPFGILITNNIYCHLNRAETYGPACKINFMHHVMVFVSCPETTKVKKKNNTVYEILSWVSFTQDLCI